MTVTFVQMLASFNEIDLKWGDLVKNYFSIASSVNANVELVKTECYTPMSYPLKYFFVQCIPLVCMLLVAGWFCFQKYMLFPNFKSYWISNSEVGRDTLVYRILNVLDICFFPVTKYSLSIFNCISSVGSKVDVLATAPSIICDVNDITYKKLLFVATLSLIIYTIFIPGLFFYLLWRNRVEIKNDLMSIRSKIVSGSHEDVGEEIENSEKNSSQAFGGKSITKMRNSSGASGSKVRLAALKLKQDFDSPAVRRRYGALYNSFKVF